MEGTKGKIFGIVLFAFLLESLEVEGGGLFGAPQALYGPEDDVVVLNGGNLNKTIYGTKNAWLVEFFSSWCGHCIHFAPIYKSFAKEVKGWQKLVKVAGIDCADENNIPTCREYEIMGYPTILFFPPNSKEFKTENERYRGEAFTRTDKVSQLKKDLMDILTPHFPSVLGDTKVLGGSPGGLWKSVKDAVAKDGSEKPSLLVLVYEKLASTIGKELALAVSNLTQVRILRFHDRNKLYNRFGMKDQWPAAGWIDENHQGAKFVIPNNENIVTALENAIRKKLKLEIISDPNGNKNVGEEIALNLKDGDKGDEEENNLEEPMIGGPSANQDVVSLEDLIHAVRNSLRNEVGILKTLSGNKLTILKQYVHILGQLFPSDRREMIVFLMKLDKYLDSHQDSLQVNDYLDKLTELELELHPWDINVNSWGSCKGSLPGRRGYTCSLWRLFHTLTILATQKTQPISVLPIIHGYVKEFFGCSECVSHFTKMVADDGALTITAARAQALWLWRAHNKVNTRLKGTSSEDPAYPKVNYPSDSLCAECHTAEEGSFNEDKVFEYLVKVYTHPARTTHDTGSKKQESKSESSNDGNSVHSNNQPQFSKNRQQVSSRFFSGTDYWIFCIVYLSVASLLIFGYYHFKLGSRRRLDPLALCRKLLHSARSLA